MPYAGKYLLARDVVSLIQPHFPNKKVECLATMHGESSLNIGAWHDNPAPVPKLRRLEPGLDSLDEAYAQLREAAAPERSEEIISRDCGLMQINIPARLIGTETEFRLRTESLDPEEYMDVAKANISAAYQLYTTPWIRNGEKDTRKWQPWVAFTTGWAMFGEPWSWKHVAGEPVGPWVVTGRFLHKAIRGVANWHLLAAKHMTPDEALAEARRLAGVYGAKGTLAYDSKRFVYWQYPDAPTAPPKDGVGPRPIKNDGVWVPNK